MDPILRTILEEVGNYRLQPYNPRLPQQDIMYLTMNIMANLVSQRLGINFRYTTSQHGAATAPCFLCQQPFREGDLCRAPDCAHLYHARCIVPHPCCPQCQAPIRSRLSPFRNDTPGPGDSATASTPPPHSPSDGAPSDS